jgi:hypothetical protein
LGKPLDGKDEKDSKDLNELRKIKFCWSIVPLERHFKVTILMVFGVGSQDA